MKEDPRIAELYAVAPPQFVAARKALAAELPAVKDLKKPAWPLWAVNQLGRRHRDAVKELLAAGEALAGAHRDALRGRADAATLRRAGREHQEALGRAERLAAGLLGEAGAGAGTGVLRRVRATLHAASIGPDAVRARLLAGTVAEELSPPDVLTGETDGPTVRPAAVRARATRAARASAEEGREAQAEARRQAAEAARQEKARAAEAARQEKARAQAKARAEKLEARAAALEEEAAELRQEARRLRRPPGH